MSHNMKLVNFLDLQMSYPVLEILRIFYWPFSHSTDASE